MMGARGLVCVESDVFANEEQRALVVYTGEAERARGRRGQHEAQRGHARAAAREGHGYQARDAAVRRLHNCAAAGFFFFFHTKV